MARISNQSRFRRRRCSLTALAKSQKQYVCSSVLISTDNLPTGFLCIAVTTGLLGLRSSLLLGVPIPEAYHAAGEALQVAVEQAVLESVENGMAKSGKAVTPWLLERVGQLTKGNAIVSSTSYL